MPRKRYPRWVIAYECSDDSLVVAYRNGDAGKNRKMAKRFFTKVSAIRAFAKENLARGGWGVRRI